MEDKIKETKSNYKSLFKDFDLFSLIMLLVVYTIFVCIGLPILIITSIVGFGIIIVSILYKSIYNIFKMFA